MNIKELRKKFIGKKWPVWWETNDGRPAGDHYATILDVLKYNGVYDFIECIFVLSAPDNRSGQASMSIEKNSIKNYEHILLG